MDIGEQIKQERAAVVEEAKTWIMTPYAHMAAVKGAGVDCAMILKEVYGKVLDWVKDVQIDYYPPDWHLHREDERYLSIVEKYATETDKPLPGDIVVVRYGRAYSHGGIVVDFPQVIHAYVQARHVVLEDFSANQEIARRPMRFFSPWLRQYGRTE